MKTMRKIAFASGVACVLLLGLAASISGVPCLECYPEGPEQCVTGIHHEPTCAWAEMTACSKARAQIRTICTDYWDELSVTTTCTWLPIGTFEATCTIEFQCLFCFDNCNF